MRYITSKPSYMRPLTLTPGEPLLDADQVESTHSLLSIYLRVYFQHAKRKADAFLKHGRISADRHRDLVAYFSYLREEILLMEVRTLREQARVIDNADAFGWLALKYLPDADTFSLIFPIHK